MTPQPLLDLTPLVRLLVTGIALAAAPLIYVGWRNRGATPIRRIHALTLLTLFLTFDLVIFGAFTRLSDSGLGCPDWPGCYGSASPIGAQAHIADAQSLMPTGPVTIGKAWIEMIHRYLATGVGVLITVIAVASWRAPARRTSSQHWWATATLIWVCIQGAFGALTVTMKLFPAIVTLHLLGALMLLALLTVQSVQQAAQNNVTSGPKADRTSDRTPHFGLHSRKRKLAWVVLAALTLQIALGGWVSTNYAVLACSEFPMCQGSWWPTMDFEQGFHIWRKLGFTADGSFIGFEALTAIHYAHRMMAVLVVLLTGALALALNASQGTRSASRWIAFLIAMQFLTGLGNVVLDWPLLAALLHTAGAAALVIAITWVLTVGHLQALSNIVKIGAKMNVSKLNT